MNRFGLRLLAVILLLQGVVAAQQVFRVDDLEFYGKRFFDALREERVPKLQGGMFDFYELAQQFDTMTVKNARRIVKQHHKARANQYAVLASIMYRPLSNVFGITYDVSRIRDPQKFFTSAAGVELFLRIMNDYVIDDGTLDAQLLLALLSIFEESVIPEASAYIKSILMEYIVAYIIAHPFKKAEHRKQIIYRTMGILMFAYYPYQVSRDESAMMWQEAKSNPNNLIHKFGNMTYEKYHQIVTRGVNMISTLTNSGTTLQERTMFNQFLLRNIFNNNQERFTQTVNASRTFLRSDQFMVDIFIPY
ncbi:hypothetical protein PVA44_06270 [Entomospira nematocerorum]|uniref:Uncharacterized protein n=1 Tax=Entomospira nematocerorum TaxID=2719987 RepID=A0A968GBT6_9SPIO|nr:hypothetical protein [Entomospira nematocera]NIZ46374.1 hypothetical protein [Entomospira nematocera]WDI33821.1 hypothetical protein PVA44_06270 [Entomospira nematocera]